MNMVTFKILLSELILMTINKFDSSGNITTITPCTNTVNFISLQFEKVNRAANILQETSN